jgi:glutathione synthase
MQIKVGVVMDPVDRINASEDSTVAMLLEIRRRGWDVFYIEAKNIFLRDNKVFAIVNQLQVQEDQENWFKFLSTNVLSLDKLDVILMRKDPPFNLNYIYTTYLLEQAERFGVLVVNKPQSLRDANEKLFASWFSDCCPPTLVSGNTDLHREFLAQHKKIVLKPLDNMGGEKVFYLQQDDFNINVILETITQHETLPVMAQKFIPEIAAGDKRILMINGEPVPYALARIPVEGDFRGNIAIGGLVQGQELTERDRFICQQVGPVLRKKGLLFVGIDVIGDYLTEINVTSPGCIRQLDDMYNLNISSQLMDVIREKLR